jgi:catechol 2,3-dioxygenase-like lactoylglutathione lyase family enzyme
MQMDHINFTVTDVQQASAFLKKHFSYTDAFDNNNADISVLAGEHGMHINLMRGKNPTYPKMFHIGFDAETEAGVKVAYDRLIADGISAQPPAHSQWGSFTFHFTCPGGDFVIEVACASEESKS